MLERMVPELPSFFGHYNVVFMAKAALNTVGPRA